MRLRPEATESIEWTDEDMRAATLLAPAPSIVVAGCGCGRRYNGEEWRALPNPRQWLELGLEIRDCACGSTISVET